MLLKEYSLFPLSKMGYIRKMNEILGLFDLILGVFWLEFCRLKIVLAPPPQVILRAECPPGTRGGLVILVL